MGKSSNDERHLIASSRNILMEPAALIDELASQLAQRNDTKTDLVADEHDIAPAGLEGIEEARSLVRPRVRVQAIAEPKREAVNEHGGPGWRLVKHLGQINRFLDHRPVAVIAGRSVMLDPLVHLVVEGGCCRDVDRRSTCQRECGTFRERTLPAAGAAEHKMSAVVRVSVSSRHSPGTVAAPARLTPWREVSAERWVGALG